MNAIYIKKGKIELSVDDDFDLEGDLKIEIEDTSFGGESSSIYLKEIDVFNLINHLQNILK